MSSTIGFVEEGFELEYDTDVNADLIDGPEDDWDGEKFRPDTPLPDAHDDVILSSTLGLKIFSVSPLVSFALRLLPLLLALPLLLPLMNNLIQGGLLL